jgi:hypothetical protein
MGSLWAKIRRRPSMPHNTGVDAKLASHESGASRQTRGITAIIVLESHSITSNAIDVRRGISVVTITTQVVWAKSIEIKEEKTH